MTRCWHIGLLLIGILLCSLGNGRAQESPRQDDNIHINADAMEQGQKDGIINASGNVVIVWKGLTLTSDRASYDSTTKILSVYGNVVMKKGKDLVRGESARFNLETNLGELNNAVMQGKESNMTVSGEKIIRLSENEFELQNSELTTCDLPDPSWKFSAERFKGNVLGYAVGRNVIFYIKNIPVLYIPWIALPVVREKTSGVLFPRLGYSNTRGAQVDVPLYWVISPSQDLQLDVDAQSRRGVGLGTDYRYIRVRGSEGHLGGYLIYDQLKQDWRGQISQSHKEIFSADMNLRMDVNINSDRTFLNDFGEKSGDYNRQSSDTNLNFLKTWQQYALTGHLRYTENLYAANDNLTLQTLPEAGVAGVRQQLYKTPLYFDVDLNLANLYRDSDISGQRLHLFPRISLLNVGGKVVNLTFWGGVHLRGYNSYNRAPGAQQQAVDGDILPEAGARISASLSKVYQPEIGSLQRLRHEIVPEVSYSYQPGHSQSRLPSYDFTDRMLLQNTVWVSATSILNGKYVSGESSEYRELSRIRLSQGYSFEGPRRDLLNLMYSLDNRSRPHDLMGVVDQEGRWSNLMLESDTWVHKYARLTFDAAYTRFDHARYHLASAAPGLEIDDHSGNMLGASYRLSRSQVEYFEGRLSTRMVKPLILSYSARYSFDKGDFLETVYSAEYRHKCWSVILAVRGRPGNQSVTVNFNLAGLMGM